MSNSSRRNLGIIVLIVVVSATFISSKSIFSTIQRFRDLPFPWDPAAYATEGLLIARDVKAADVVSFIGDTSRQGFWPFFHSWLLAPAFILFGSTPTSARVVSLFCFILFIPVLYLVSVRTSEKRGHWVGLVTVFLALTSIPILAYAAECFEEMPGLLLTFATFLFYLKALKAQRSGLYIWTSFFMTLTFFTKWHHGLLVVVPIVLTQLTMDRKLLSRSNLCLFLPFLSALLVWFSYPRHVSSFIGYSTFQPHFYKLFSLENFLFYPKSFLVDYHAAAIVAIIVAAGFAFSLRHIKDPKIRLFIFQVLIGIAMVTLKLEKRPRYMLTIIPSMWILASGQLVELVDYLRIRMNSRRTRIALAATGIVTILAVSFFAVPRTYKAYPDWLRKYEYYFDQRQNEAYQFITSHIGDHDQIALFGTWIYYNHLKGSTLRWNIEVQRDKNVSERTNTKKLAMSYFSQLMKKRDKKSYDALVNFLENKNVRVSEYSLSSFMKNQDEGAYRDYERKNTFKNPFSDRIIDVHSLDKNISCLITIHNQEEEELNFYGVQFMMRQPEWKRVMSQKFDDLGITIAIYQRMVAPRET
jgi:hypothetical protein